MLPWHMPNWSWWKPWEWPGHALSWLKGWSEYREAAHRARLAKIQADTAEAGQETALFEAKVGEMIRRIRKAQVNARPNAVLEATPDEDQEVFREAMRRVVAEDRQGRIRRHG
jgi:hypothetical protein